MKLHLWKELNGPGKCRSAGNEDCTFCLLHQGPDELSPLGVICLQGMAFITDHHPKTAETLVAVECETACHHALEVIASLSLSAVRLQ